MKQFAAMLAVVSQAEITKTGVKLPTPITEVEPSMSFYFGNQSELGKWDIILYGATDSYGEEGYYVKIETSGMTTCDDGDFADSSTTWYAGEYGFIVNESL